MNLLEKIILYLFPNLNLRRNSWKELFYNKEKESFLFSAYVFLGIVAPIYILHYHTVDRAEGLAPSDLWFNYRYGMASLAVFGFIFYKFVDIRNYKFLKVPLAVACLIFTVFQAKTVFWYSKVPYLYAYMFVLISTYILRLQVGYALIYSGINLLFISLIYKDLEISSSMIFSANIVTLIFTIFISARNSSSVKLFIASQNDIENKQKLIQANMQLVEQIRAFLPKNIFNRIIDLHKNKRMNLTQSMDEVLRPRNTDVCCIYSDIRGFTLKSQNLEGFVKKEMIPLMKECSMVIEDYGGVPRKIGDLIFAYFEVNISTNIKSKTDAVTAALTALSKMIEIEKEMKETHSLDLKRNSILTFGNAIVGNIGGVNSSVEITAIGSPSNLAARIDEWSKRSSLRVKDTMILFDPAVKSVLLDIGYGSYIHTVQISELKIRDFEFIENLYFIDIEELNLQPNQIIHVEAS